MTEIHEDEHPDPADGRTQVFMKNLFNRYVRLDVLAAGGIGRKVNRTITQATTGSRVMEWPV